MVLANTHTQQKIIGHRHEKQQGRVVHYTQIPYGRDEFLYADFAACSMKNLFAICTPKGDVLVRNNEGGTQIVQ